MANVKFIHQALEGKTLTMDASENPTYPMSNLKDRNPLTLWKGPGTAQNQWLTIDFGAIRTCDTIIVGNHNFTTLAVNVGIDLRASTDNFSSSNVEIVHDLTAANGTSETEFASTALYRYWRIKFSSTVALGAIPQIGNLFLGARADLSLPYNRGLKHGESYQTSFSRAIDTTPYMSQNTNDGLETWNFNWSNLGNTDKNSFLTLYNSVRGRLYPFYFIDTDGTTIRLVILKSDINLMVQKHYQIHDTPEVQIEAFSAQTLVIA